MLGKLKRSIRKRQVRKARARLRQAEGSVELRWCKPPIDSAPPIDAGQGAVPVNQIFLTDSAADVLPPFFQLASSSVVDAIPRAAHKIYFKDELRDWIVQEYGGVMARAFDKLIPYAYKADLARYLLLYKHGGWYFDISIRVLATLDVPADVDLVTFSENPAHSGVSYGCHTGIIYAKRGSIILQDVIESVYRNIRLENYGKNSLYPTGPVCFGRSVAKYEEGCNVIQGVFTDLTPSFHFQTKGFVFQNGTLFALYKPNNGGGDLTSLGLQGGNSYPELYDARLVYDKSIVLPESWSHGEAQRAPRSKLVRPTSASTAADCHPKCNTCFE